MPAFAVSPILGLTVTVSILIHEVLQEISEFFVLKQAGYSTKRALLVNLLVSSSIFVGIGIGYFALATHELEGVLLALSAGFFFHVVLHDLLPKRHEHQTTQVFIEHLGVLVVGLLIMGGVAFAFGDSHSHGDEISPDEHVHDADNHGHDHDAAHHEDQHIH